MGTVAAYTIEEATAAIYVVHAEGDGELENQDTGEIHDISS